MGQEHYPDIINASRRIKSSEVKDCAAGIPGMNEYLADFTNEKAWGDDGYLAKKGLVPMSKGERKKFAAEARNPAGF